jgi:hypothetical protein
LPPVDIPNTKLVGLEITVEVNESKPKAKKLNLSKTSLKPLQ